VIRNFLFWFCVPWAVFFGVAVIANGIHKPGVIPMAVLLVLLIGVAARAEYVKAKARADAMLADAQELTRKRMMEDATRTAGGAGPTPFNPRGPGQFTSFAFRYGLPPDALKRKGPKVLPPPPPALPPPAADE
jgi:hypothetical protein